MPVIRYWDVAQAKYIDLPGLPGAAGGPAYADVQNTPPTATSPSITPPNGLLWVDTSVTATQFQGPPGVVDQGINNASDLNTVQTAGNYGFNNTPANSPPIPAGAFVLETQVVGAGAYIQQRATLLSNPAFIATRVYSGGAWGAWHSPAAGLIGRQTGPASAGTPSTLLTATFSTVINRQYLVAAAMVGGGTGASPAGAIRWAVSINGSATGMGVGVFLWYDNAGTPTPVSTARNMAGAFGFQATGTSTSVVFSNPGTANAGSVAINSAIVELYDEGI